MLLAYVKTVKSNASIYFGEMKINKSSRYIDGLKLKAYSWKNPGCTVVEYTQSTVECEAYIFHKATADDMRHFRFDVSSSKDSAHFGRFRKTQVYMYVPESVEIYRCSSNVGNTTQIIHSILLDITCSLCHSWIKLWMSDWRLKKKILHVVGKIIVSRILYW